MLTEQELSALTIAIGVLKRENMLENAEILKALRMRLSLASDKQERPKFCQENCECSRSFEEPVCSYATPSDKQEAVAHLRKDKFGNFDVVDANIDGAFPVYAAPLANPIDKQEAVKLCTICNGYGRYQDGHSGTEADGYAPNIVVCECNPSDK